jgi:ribosomal protein S12 methylthiotransferase accessory factor YcaO
MPHLSNFYEAMCNELHIAPYIPKPDIKALHRNSDHISLSFGDAELQYPIVDLNLIKDITYSCFLRDERLGVVSFYNFDNSTYCPACLRDKLSIYEGYVGSPLDAIILNDHDFLIPFIMDRLHGFPIATGFHHTNQNWSVLTPLPGCDVCTSGEKKKSLSSILSTASNANIIGFVSSSKNNPMSIDDDLADGFVTKNRWAIGFGSIIGNIVVEDDMDFPATYACNFCDKTNVQIASGKGTSLSKALAGCLGEGIERYFLDGSFSEYGQIIESSNTIGFFPKTSLHKNFGFPYKDPAYPSSNLATETDPIEWSFCEELTSSSISKLIPSNFVFCPYRAKPGANYISMSSTNGAATGRDLLHATRSALLECVERDAFAYYSRTDAKPVGIIQSDWPLQISNFYDRNQYLKFAVTLLPSPFHGVTVAQVTMRNSLGEAPISVRGTGAAFSEVDAVIRAASECVQMLHSLRDTGDDPRATDDMRDVWRSGKACEVWPEYFYPTNNRNLLPFQNQQSTADEIDSIIAAAKEQNISIFRHIIYTSENFSVVKCVFTSNCVADAFYFENNKRFDQFSSLMGEKCREVVYRGPLFM